MQSAVSLAPSGRLTAPAYSVCGGSRESQGSRGAPATARRPRRQAPARASCESMDHLHRLRGRIAAQAACAPRSKFFAPFPGRQAGPRGARPQGSYLPPPRSLVPTSSREAVRRTPPPPVRYLRHLPRLSTRRSGDSRRNSGRRTWTRLFSSFIVAVWLFTVSWTDSQSHGASPAECCGTATMRSRAASGRHPPLQFGLRIQAAVSGRASARRHGAGGRSRAQRSQVFGGGWRPQRWLQILQMRVCTERASVV